MSASGRLCCKSRKLQSHGFFCENTKREAIADSYGRNRVVEVATLGDEVPHIFTRKPRLRPLEFLIIGAKRLLQHNLTATDPAKFSAAPPRPRYTEGPGHLCCGMGGQAVLQR